MSSQAVVTVVSTIAVPSSTPTAPVDVSTSSIFVTTTSTRSTSIQTLFITTAQTTPTPTPSLPPGAVPNTPPPAGHNRNWIVGVVLGAVSVDVILILLCVCWRRRKKQRAREAKRLEREAQRSQSQPGARASDEVPWEDAPRAPRPDVTYHYDARPGGVAVADDYMARQRAEGWVSQGLMPISAKRYAVHSRAEGVGEEEKRESEGGKGRGLLGRFGIVRKAHKAETGAAVEKGRGVLFDDAQQRPAEHGASRFGSGQEISQRIPFADPQRTRPSVQATTTNTSTYGSNTPSASPPAYAHEYTQSQESGTVDQQATAPTRPSRGENAGERSGSRDGWRNTVA